MNSSQARANFGNVYKPQLIDSNGDKLKPFEYPNIITKYRNLILKFRQDILYQPPRFIGEERFARTYNEESPPPEGPDDVYIRLNNDNADAAHLPNPPSTKRKFILAGLLAASGAAITTGLWFGLRKHHAEDIFSTDLIKLNNASEFFDLDTRFNRFYYPLEINLDDVSPYFDEIDEASVLQLQNFQTHNPRKKIFFKTDSLQVIPTGKYMWSSQHESVANLLLGFAINYQFGLMINLENAWSDWSYVDQMADFLECVRSQAAKLKKHAPTISVRIPSFWLNYNYNDPQRIINAVDDVSLTSITGQFYLDCTDYQSPLGLEKVPDGDPYAYCEKPTEYPYIWDIKQLTSYKHLFTKPTGLIIYTDGMQFQVDAVGEYHGLWRPFSTFTGFVCYDSINYRALPEGTICLKTEDNPDGRQAVAPLCYKPENGTDPGLFITYSDPTAVKAVTQFAKTIQFSGLGFATQTGNPCNASALQDAAFAAWNGHATPKSSSSSFASFFKQQASAVKKWWQSEPHTHSFFQTKSQAISKWLQGENTWLQKLREAQEKVPAKFNKLITPLRLVENKLKSMHAENSELIFSSFFDILLDKNKSFADAKHALMILKKSLDDANNFMTDKNVGAFGKISRTEEVAAGLTASTMSHEAPLLSSSASVLRLG